MIGRNNCITHSRTSSLRPLLRRLEETSDSRKIRLRSDSDWFLKKQCKWPEVNQTSNMAESTPRKSWTSLVFTISVDASMKIGSVENIRVIFASDPISRSESILLLLEGLYTGFTIADDSTQGFSTAMNCQVQTSLHQLF